MIGSGLDIRTILSAWNRFFHSERDLSTCCVLRVVYALLLLVNLAFLAPDVGKWFGPEGVLSLEASRKIIDSDLWSLFHFLPDTTATVWICFALFVVQAVLLLLGVLPRLQALCVFIWLCSFQHRNIILFDGEDVLFRVMAFLLIWMPIGARLSWHSWRRSRNGEPPLEVIRPVWPLRLMQLQMTLIYGASVVEKLKGTDWVQGTALYYVSRLDDLWGRFPIPGFVAGWFDSLTALAWMGWGVLFAEAFVAAGLWIKQTRLLALLVAVGIHLSLDYFMNLFLFQWLMITGLIVFTNWRLPTKAGRVETTGADPSKADDSLEPRANESARMA